MIDMKMKEFFFDRQKVVDAMDKASKAALSKAGAFIRQTARSSMRKRKRASEPGKPPSVHVGTLKKLLYFAYDPAQRSVVIGPQKFAKGEAGPLNEFGGRAVRRDRRTRQKRTVTYVPRPFMAPALAKELPKLPARWANSLKS
jgi:hypothetical protein